VHDMRREDWLDAETGAAPRAEARPCRAASSSSRLATTSTCCVATAASSAARYLPRAWRHTLQCFATSAAGHLHAGCESLLQADMAVQENPWLTGGEGT
jgi:hypothetical protein